jgi:citrate lyase subunit alpha/citrate CoA-transferase
MKEKIVNSLGISLPSFIEGYGDVKPYKGAFATKATGRKYAPLKGNHVIGHSKIVTSIKDVLKLVEIKDGMRISFHHHLRDGDHVINMVMDEIAQMGVKNITICPSSLTEAHTPLIDHIRTGVITGIETSGLRGEIGKEVAINNILKRPVIFRTHGGRARAIEAGEVVIDVTFIAAPTCDFMGNMNGIEGKSAFGAMGYPMVDAEYAHKVVAITDNLVDYPVKHISIPQTLVDYVVKIDSIGDATKISTGATRITSNPTDLKIAEDTSKVLIASGLVQNGFAFQAGSGGAALAVVQYLQTYMQENNIKGSFASGGITMHLVELLEQNFFEALLDVQTFDGDAARSFTRNKNHIEMSSSMYANPHNKGCVAHLLDIMILSATEVDIHFNINSLTGSTGRIMGAIGGAPDTAAGSKLTVVVAPSIRNRIPIIVDQVGTIITPGETVDILVTERGISVNPKRADLLAQLKDCGLTIKPIEELKKEIHALTGTPEELEYEDTIVGVVEYRDGTVIDVIKQVKE